MSVPSLPVPRVLVASVTTGRGRAIHDPAKGAVEEVRAAAGRLTLVRSVVVKGESQYIRQLVHHVSNDNEADAIVMIGGVGIGPRDVTIESLESFFERRIEGFGHAYRRLLRDEFKDVNALLARATAGIYNSCLVFALPSHAASVRRAVQLLIAPALAEGVALAAVDEPMSIAPGSVPP